MAIESSRKIIRGRKHRRLDPFEVTKEGDIMKVGERYLDAEPGYQVGDIEYWRPFKGECTPARRKADLVRECKEFLDEELYGLCLDDATDTAIAAALLARWIEERGR